MEWKGSGTQLKSLRWLPLLVLLFQLVANVKAQCECGFVMNDTKDYLTHIIHSDFSSFQPSKTLSLSQEFKRDWVVQKWGMPPLSWATPLPIYNRHENVFIEDGQLVLRQEGYPKEAILLGRNVSVASIASRDGSILHGSFRAEIKLEGASGGSVAGFFWYHDDENEIDIEILTKEFKPDHMLVHYTTHPALDENGVLIKNSTEIIPLKGDNPADSFQRHRFDWTKKELRFYQNDKTVHKNNLRIPTDSGHVYMNLWADGGLWSGSPSTTDVFLRVKSMAIFHNTTMSDEGKDLAFNLRCEKAGGLSHETVCLDLHVENGIVVPSLSESKALAPLPIWVLFCFVWGVFVSTI